jgi:hypothetical protein
MDDLIVALDAREAGYALLKIEVEELLLQHGTPDPAIQTVIDRIGVEQQAMALLTQEVRDANTPPLP